MWRLARLEIKIESGLLIGSSPQEPDWEGNV